MFAKMIKNADEIFPGCKSKCFGINAPAQQQQSAQQQQRPQNSNPNAMPVIGSRRTTANQNYDIPLGNPQQQNSQMGMNHQQQQQQPGGISQQQQNYLLSRQLPNPAMMGVRRAATQDDVHHGRSNTQLF